MYNLPTDLVLFISFKTLNFFGLVNLTKSIRTLILICKKFNYILHSDNSIWFWRKIWKSVNWKWNNELKSGFDAWTHFHPCEFLSFRQLSSNMLLLRPNGYFTGKISDINQLPTKELIKRVINSGIKLNDVKLFISPTSKFLAIYGDSHITMYKDNNIYYQHKLNFSYCELFELHNEPVLIYEDYRYRQSRPRLFFKNGNVEEVHYKQNNINNKEYNSYNGGIFSWNLQNITYISNHFETLNGEINCVTYSNELPTVCRQSGIIVIEENNRLVAFTPKNHILWEKNINEVVHTCAIGYGFLTLANKDLDKCWIIDIYTGHTLLQVDDDIIKQQSDFWAESTAVQNEIGYEILWR